MRSVAIGSFSYTWILLTALFHLDSADIHGVRLRGGPTPGQGKVEVKNAIQWGAVCDDHWTLTEADVVCKQLGYTNAVKALRNSPFGEARGPIWLKTVKCGGAENKLSDCSYETVNTNRESLYENTNENLCSYDHQAGVICKEPQNPDAALIRLGNHILSSGPSGRKSRMVTLHMKGQWMPICSNTWSSKEAIVACRQAGQGFATLVEKISATSSDVSETYTKSVIGVKCNGDESSLLHCKVEGETESCPTPPYYASVLCDEKSPDISINITVLEPSIGIKWVYEQKLVCAKEEQCLSDSGMSKKGEDLQHSGFKRKFLVFTSAVQNFGNADFRPPNLENGWHYHQCHKHYHSIQDFAKYELRDQKRNVIEVGHKVSFCLRDNVCVNSRQRKYRCSRHAHDDDTQGLSIGCTDIYTNTLDCQWIDITDVKSGSYTLEINSNPYLLVPEHDYSNNFVVCDVKISENMARGSNCRYPADFEDYVPYKVGH